MSICDLIIIATSRMKLSMELFTYLVLSLANETVRNGF